MRGSALIGHTVRWGCDNWAAGKIVALGSMKPKCDEVAKRIQMLVKKHEIKLEPYWLSRESEQIVFCDALSKDFDTADYAIDMDSFRRLDKYFGGFTVDLFASSFSYRMKPFVSKIACSEAAEVDAFSVDWGKEFRFIHPPVGLVVRALRYAEECKAAGVLIVPDWSGSIFKAVL